MKTPFSARAFTVRARASRLNAIGKLCPRRGRFSTAGQLWRGWRAGHRLSMVQSLKSKVQSREHRSPSQTGNLSGNEGICGKSQGKTWGDEECFVKECQALGATKAVGEMNHVE